MLEDRGHEVVAAVGEGNALLEEAREHRPDETVADIRIPSTCRPARLRDRRSPSARRPAVPAVVDTDHLTYISKEGSGADRHPRPLPVLSSRRRREPVRNTLPRALCCGCMREGPSLA
jgi:hypothetical protein